MGVQIDLKLNTDMNLQNSTNASKFDMEFETENTVGDVLKGVIESLGIENDKTFRIKVNRPANSGLYLMATYSNGS